MTTEYDCLSLLSQLYTGRVDFVQENYFELVYHAAKKKEWYGMYSDQEFGQEQHSSSITAT
jgi:hypothetical protein